MGLGPVVVCVRVSVHEVTWAEGLSERRLTQSVHHASLKVEEHLLGHVFATLGLVVKQFDALGVRVVFAAVLAVAADAMLVAHHLPRRGTHLVTALARLHVRNFRA
jgi:hypothetical protein